MSYSQTTTFSQDNIVNPQVEIFIPKDFVNDLPLYSYGGRIELVEKDDQVEMALNELNQFDVLGFDTESRPSFKKGESHPPSLLQLGGDKVTYLFQLQKIENVKPIFDFLSSSQHLKAGVAIRDDIKKLKEIADFDESSFVEIADHTQKANIVNTGLRNLAGLFLHLRISKGAQVSNWAKSELTLSQIRYAATDADVSRKLFIRIRELGLYSR